tara:strand:+ start:279 stop:695 length:417 start_codon:yes stop_codon:yes gene_type:complete
MIEARLVDQGQNAKITKDGQLVVGDVDFSHFYLGSTASNDVPVNVVPPKPGKRFIITAIILSGDRSIGASGAVTDIYESDIGPVDTVIETEIIQEEIAKQTRLTATGLHIEVNQGKWVNVKSDDVIVRCNIAGYYVDA